MQPAAVLSVIVEVQRVNEARAGLTSVNSELTKVDSTAKRVGQTMTTVGGRMEKVGKTMTRYVAAPLLAVGVASGVMAAKFNRSMNLIMTDAGGSVKEVKALSTAVLKLGEHSEFGPQKLADSLFYIESAGIRGKKAIQDLNEIQRAAMSGNADLETAVFGVVGAYNALGKEGKNIPQILATMNSVVGHGHLRLEELTKALSTGLLGAGKTFGLNFMGMGSALAFFTRMSEPAQQAATRMRQTITHLASSSTNKAKEAIESIGMSVDGMSEKINNTHRLGPVIKELADHLEGLTEAEKNQVLTDAFGGGRYGTQIREAIANVDLLLKTEKEVAEKATIGRLRKAEMEQEKSAMVQMKILWSQIEVALIRLGNVILPIVVPIFKSVVHWIMGVSEWFDKLSPSTKHWIVVIGLLVIAVTILIRVVGGFIKSMGEIVGWFGKTEVANAELIASNQAVATSYAELTASAEAALAARKEMEYASGPYAGGIQATKAGLPTEKDLAPSTGMQVKGMLGSLGRGLTTGIPGMFAAYGIGNIITSVMSGDMQDAGFEGGGALVGGLAAVLTGNPELAGVGVGVGSLVGEFASKAFNDIFSSETDAEMRKKSHQGIMHNYRSQYRHAAKAAEGAQEAIHESSQEIHQDKKREVKITHEQSQAAQHLIRVVAKYGEGSRAAAVAQAELNQVKHKGINVDQALEAAEKQHGVLRRATMRQDRAEVAAAKELIEKVGADRAEAIQKLSKIEHEAPSQVRFEKESRWLKRVKQDSEELHTVQAKMWGTVKSAGSEIGPSFAKQLEAINPQLNRMKEASREAGESMQEHMGKIRHGFKQLSGGTDTLAEIATGFKRTKSKTEDFSSTMAGPFTSKTDGSFKNTAEQATKWQETMTTAMGAVNSEAASIVEAWGGNAPAAVKKHGNKHKETIKKAQGGHIPGIRSGDLNPALLEDGEYVVNREAVKAVGKHNLDRLNFGLAPRFAEGGVIGQAVAEAESIIGVPYVWGGGHSSFSANGGLDCSGAVSDVLHAAGLIGRPMVSGELMSWGMPGAGPITVFANPGHAWMSIQGHPFGTSVDDSSKGLNWYPQPPAGYKSGFSVRHANVSGSFGGAGQQVEIPEIIGGPPKLNKMGNSQLAGIGKAANEWIAKNEPGKWGGGDMGEGGAPGSIAQVMKEITIGVKGAGGNKVSAAGIIGNAYRESLLNPASVGTGGGGLWGFTSGEISLASLQAAAGRANEAWTSVPFQTEFMLRHGGAGLLGVLNEAGSPEAAARIFMEEWEKPGIPALDEREAWARKAFTMGYKQGGGVPAKAFGAAEALAKGPPKPTGPPITGIGKQLNKIGGELTESVKTAKKGHYPAAGGIARKAVRKLGKVEGLGVKQMESLVKTSSQIAEYQEYANNAAGLNTLEEEPENAPENWFAKTIFGQFLGQDEGYWLSSELNSLGALRNNLISAKDSIQSPMFIVNEMVKRFKHMLHGAEKQMRGLHSKEHHIEQEIHEIEKYERETIHRLEKEKQEIENAEHVGAHKLEQEKNELENQLNKLQNAKTPDKVAIQNVRNQIGNINSALHNTNKAGSAGVKEVNEKIHNVENKSHDEIKSDNKKLTHVKQSIAQVQHQIDNYNEFVPQLEEKRTAIQETAGGLMSGYTINNGPLKGKSWEGLTEVQGRVNNFAPVAELPRGPEGGFGGNILSVQMALQQYGTINTPPKGKAPGPTPIDTERLQLEKEIELINKEREQIRQVQGAVMESFPSVREIAIPFAGAYALGGMVAAEVGERGKEIAVMPTGTQMVSHYDAMGAIGGDTHLNFEHVEFHEDTGKAVGRLNGEEFEFDAEVKRVNREQARGASASRTPGGRSR